VSESEAFEIATKDPMTVMVVTMMHKTAGARILDT
jgi:hypothetical protein